MEYTAYKLARSRSYQGATYHIVPDSIPSGFHEELAPLCNVRQSLFVLDDCPKFANQYFEDDNDRKYCGRCRKEFFGMRTPYGQAHRNAMLQ